MSKTEFRKAIVQALEAGGEYSGRTRSQGQDLGYTHVKGWRLTVRPGPHTWATLEYLRGAGESELAEYDTIATYARLLRDRFALREVRFESERQAGRFTTERRQRARLEIWPLGEPDPTGMSRYVVRVTEQATTLYTVTIDTTGAEAAERLARRTYRRGTLQPLETTITTIEITGEAPAAEQ